VQVNTESQTLSNTISTQQVTELPSLTRNPYDFVATVPNVTSDMQSGRGVGYAIDGMRSSSTNVMLDGVATTMSSRPPSASRFRSIRCRSTQ